jgi:hypothetical protein
MDERQTHAALSERRGSALSAADYMAMLRDRADRAREGCSLYRSRRIGAADDAADTQPRRRAVVTR